MSSPPSFSFSKPAMPGDVLSVSVLVEDSVAMAAKWPDIRNTYLPNLLENLRSADPSVQMEARWLTASSASPVSARSILDPAQARSVPELPLAAVSAARLSPAAISHAITTLSSATRRQSTTRHLILVVATGPQMHGLNDTIPSGFDPWDDIAIALKQKYIRLHVILNIGAEMWTYHELFKRSLQLQNNLEVPAWFLVDSQRYSIRLSGRPQYMRGSVAMPIAPVLTPFPDNPANNLSPPGPAPSPASPPGTTSSSLSSPVLIASPGSCRSPHSPLTPQTHPHASDSPQSPLGGAEGGSNGGGGGLVSYLQQMHGLTKKKSYGIKAPKKTYADIRLPRSGRPILPRLQAPQARSSIYTYPSFDAAPGTGPDGQPPSSLPDLHQQHQQQQQPPPGRHLADQLPPLNSNSLVMRTSIQDRRARRRGPWLPIAPLVLSTPPPPTTGMPATLQSPAATMPCQPDPTATDINVYANGAKECITPGASDPRAAYMLVTQAAVPVPAVASDGAYYLKMNMNMNIHANGNGSNANDNVPTWSLHLSSADVGIGMSVPMSMSSPSTASIQGPSPSYSDAAPRPFQPTSPPTTLLAGSDDGRYSSSPPSSLSPSSVSLHTAPVTGQVQAQADRDDQPFIVTPEYEAIVNAHFEEAIRWGAMQASMTPAIHSAVPAPSPYTSQHGAQNQQQQHYYSEAQPQDAGYAAYQVTRYPQEGAGWAHASAHYGHRHDHGHGHTGHGYMEPVAGYAPPQGHWYPA